jgi:sugar phosphate isomerase/epimerase
MKLGFFTACFDTSSLEQIAGWAQKGGFQALEIAVWPASGNRAFAPTHIDVVNLNESAAEAIRGGLDARELVISSLGFYGNNLHPDATQRLAANEHVKRVIDAAVLLGVDNIGTFIGRDPGLSVAENLKLAESIFPPIVDYAGERGVNVVIENCVMEGWHPDGYPGNLAYSPELWEWMFGLGLYLNFDPSHLVWLGIDPVAALRPYVSHVKHVQAKDIQLFPEKRTRYGWPGRAVDRTDPWDTGWWRYRIPGLGEVDWSGIIDALAEGGYDGVVSIEHEDPVWSGSVDRIRSGLEIGRRTLQGIILP